MNGLMILFIGIVGQYVGRIYMEVKERPRFIVDEKYPKPSESATLSEYRYR